MDVNVLYDLKDYFDDMGIYEWDEVVQFNELFFGGVEVDQLLLIFDIVVGWFDEFEDDEKIDIKIKVKQFVKIYVQVVCIILFENVNWEMLYWFLKFFIFEMKVKDKDQDQIDGLLESVDLIIYGLEWVKIGYIIGLDDSDSEIDFLNVNLRGGYDDLEIDFLDMIIVVFNE